MRELRSARRSLCCNPGHGLYRFHKCTAKGGITCFVDDDMDRVLNSLSITKQYVLRANVKTVIDKAKRGILNQSQNPRYNPLAEPCATQPDIWELRWNIRREPYRMYYSADGTRNHEFVALSFSHKITEGLTDSQIRDRQNDAISKAQSLFDRYEYIKWGHIDGNCKHCI